jgi:hypothetical protein
MYSWFLVSAVVVKGKQRGRQIGYKTANLNLQDPKIFKNTFENQTYNPSRGLDSSLDFALDLDLGPDLGPDFSPDLGLDYFSSSQAKLPPSDSVKNFSNPASNQISSLVSSQISNPASNLSVNLSTNQEQTSNQTSNQSTDQGIHQNIDQNFNQTLEQTSNLSVSPVSSLALNQIKQGVYASFMWVGGEIFESVSHLGAIPTFDEPDLVLETHILNNFDRDIYGQLAGVFLLKYLRPNHKFEKVAQLVEQMKKDCNQAKKVLNCLQNLKPKLLETATKYILGSFS